MATTIKSSISDLKSALSNHSGLSRLCKYRVDFSGWPDNEKRASISPTDARNLDFFLEGINVPGKTLSSVKYSVWDKPIDLPTGYENQELSMDFMMPNDHYIRNIFSQWMSNIINPTTQLISYHNEYSCHMNVYFLNDVDDVAYTLNFTGVYPLSYSAQQFSAASAEYGKLSVSFAYDKMNESKMSSGSNTQTSGSGRSAAFRDKLFGDFGDFTLPLTTTTAGGRVRPDGTIINPILSAVQQAHNDAARFRPSSAAQQTPGSAPPASQVSASVPPVENYNPTAPANTPLNQINDTPQLPEVLTSPNLADPPLTTGAPQGSISQPVYDTVTGSTNQISDFDPSESGSLEDVSRESAAVWVNHAINLLENTDLSQEEQNNYLETIQAVLDQFPDIERITE